MKPRIGTFQGKEKEKPIHNHVYSDILDITVTPYRVYFGSVPRENPLKK